METSRSSTEGSGRPTSRPLQGRRVLVANRGEIACRILRAIRDEGGLGIALFSDADRDALHVRLADEAYRIGPAPVGESYLDAAAILDLAQRRGAELLHPGYGFFAENGAFAQAVLDAGIVWVGPSPEALRTMGDKLAARRTVEGTGVAVVPGSGELPPSGEHAVEEASRLGYPVLLKAAFGGGGKGMRICSNPEELLAGIELAGQEAGRAFGNATIYIEKVIEKPRHVEIQILADNHGQVVHLGERECSIQRRHQKLLEESPAPARVPRLRERMGEAAVEIARRIGYSNAGTVEFLLDPSGKFYFLEMNTRLQVEHPVTEMVTGLDIVRRQLRIALGEPLDLVQDRITWRGHAIECRINAEDPERDFVPSTGRILAMQLPEGAGVRNDTGVLPGTEVTPHYDPLLGKLIVWGEDRKTAIARCLRALHEYRIAGVRTNLPFHAWLLAHPRFAGGEIDTGFIAAELRSGDLVGEEDEITAVIAAALSAYRGTVPTGIRTAEAGSAWKLLGRPGRGGRGWR